MPNELDSLNASVFSAHIHSRFNARIDASTSVPLTLESVDERPTPPKFECFSLTFKGPESPQLDQALRELEHEVLGTFSLFLVPVGKEGANILYEAVFNRVRKQA
jgi:hypothetical protein